MKIIAVYDAGDNYADRYTVYFDFLEDIRYGVNMFLCLCLGCNPFHPQGFCQHSSGALGKHNGKRISFNQLPEDCQKAVLEDIA